MRCYNRHEFFLSSEKTMEYYGRSVNENNRLTMPTHFNTIVPVTTTIFYN